MQTNILDWLEATAARCPNAPAVGDVQQDYTWAQLAELARRSGSALAARTAPRCPAAFYLEKSASAFAAMLGTVYAGCCYSVLDLELFCNSRKIAMSVLSRFVVFSIMLYIFFAAVLHFESV